MGILKSHGALDQFLKLQGELGRLESEVESVRQRFEAAEQLEGTKNELEIERNRLTIRLRRDFAEQKDRLSEAIVAFEETSQRLYEAAGSMTIDETSNGPSFKFQMQEMCIRDSHGSKRQSGLRRFDGGAHAHQRRPRTGGE